MPDKTSNAKPVPETEDIRAVLDRLLVSETFANAGRSRDLLRFVVEEALAGRGADLRAKTIALDLYGYSAAEAAQRENAIRVDARRLRAKLAEYYDNEGRDDPIAIDLPKGGYAPVFAHARLDPRAEGRHPAPRRWLKPALGLAIGACLGVAGTWVILQPRTSAAPDPVVPDPVAPKADRRAERSAIFENSPPRLQAMSISQEGRDLIFPAVNLQRLRSALVIFRYAIDLDPSYFGGYAGAAQVHAMFALMTPDPKTADLESDAARDLLARAVELAPDAAWTLSAQAWGAFVRRDYDRALRLSQRAVALDGADPHLVEFDALIALYAGDFDYVKRVATRVLEQGLAGKGYVFQNALGAARYHSGDNTGTIVAFDEAIADGAPIGPFSVVYPMAAYHRLGDQKRAGELAEIYRKSWPGQDLEGLIVRLFRDASHADALIGAMRGAGLVNAD